jgi:DNA repair protein RadA/Sms
VRPVAHAGVRLREAAKLGFRQVHGPDGAAEKVDGLRFSPIRLLPNLVDRVMSGA